MKSFALFVVLLAPFAHSQSAATAGDARVAELREAAESYRVEHGIVGLAFAVIDDGEVVLDAALGLRDREDQLAVQPATLFRLASLSKTVTATLAMQLVDAKKLELDADVHRYVKGLEPKLPPITLRQILSHTSGIRHYRDDRTDGGTQHRTTAEALELFVHDPLLFEPGAKFSYSTHAFTLAAAVVEGASERPFVDCVRASIAKGVAPSLDCEVAGDAKPERSALYEKTQSGAVVLSTPREDLSWKYGGGGLESTALDVARFCDAVLHAKLVSEASRDWMWTPAKLANGKSVDYGLGWGIGENGNVAQHTGSQQGASSALLVLRDAKLVIVVLTNTENGGAPGLMPKLREIATKGR